MAHGLEVRVPFLDNDLVDFAEALPRAVRLGAAPSDAASMEPARPPSNGKRILRKAMRGVLPEVILDAPKQGFAGPDSQWFSRDLRLQVMEHTRLLDPSVVDPSVAESILGKALDAPTGARHLSWSLCAVSLLLNDYCHSEASHHDATSTEREKT
jgi:asparagine synthase (glutamine-hydrolysing)